MLEQELEQTKSSPSSKLIKPVITKQDLVTRTEFLVKNDSLSYVEAIIHICNDLDIDPEDIAKIIPPPLKEKLLVEAQRNHNVPVSSNTGSLFDDCIG